MEIPVNSNAPPYSWTKEVNTTTYLMNINPSRFIGRHTQEEIYIGVQA
jgi:hypothetical protein